MSPARTPRAERCHAAYPGRRGGPVCGATGPVPLTATGRAVTCLRCRRRLRAGISYMDPETGATMLWTEP